MKQLLVFFISIIILLITANCGYNANTRFVYANQKQSIVRLNDKTYIIDLGGADCSVLRTKINALDTDLQLRAINKIIKMGFSLEEAICYVYPNFKQSVNNICNSLLILPQEPEVYAEDNNCKIMFKHAKNGVIVDKNALFCDFFKSLSDGSNISVKLLPTFAVDNVDNLRAKFKLVSKFETSFATSSDSRKNNICVASKAINGQFIKSGQVFSFNKATGTRNEQNGYKSAKVIENGAYVEGFGGGVCQVSTTLYNACILAGLPALEVHNHSLPTSYVDPAFDAMVNMGTSDLKIKNNTDNDFLITTSTVNDKCCVCIYGVMPEYTIKTRYEKYQEIPAKADIIETDNSKYNNAYEKGEHRISYGVNGYKAKGYLDYYKDGVLIKSELIRDNTYQARQGVVLIV